MKENTYQLFCAMEYCLRPMMEMLTTPSPPSKATMISETCSDEDVQFYWLIASAEFEIDDKETHEILLTKTVNEFITVRGFAKAGAWMEKFKQISKKPTQRSKGLRRDVYYDIDVHDDIYY